jgi:hypothetical protein
MQSRIIAAPLLGLAVLLAGCSGRSGMQQALNTAPCPRIGILADAADLTKFRSAGSQDLSDLELDARIGGFNAKCDYARNGRGLEVVLTMSMRAERGPAATGRTADLPYLIAVVDEAGNRVLSRQAFAARVTFPSNVNRAEIAGEEISVTIPGSREVAQSRAVLLGFQLSEEQLALNRRRGPR